MYVCLLKVTCIVSEMGLKSSCVEVMLAYCKILSSPIAVPVYLWKLDIFGNKLDLFILRRQVNSLM